MIVPWKIVIASADVAERRAMRNILAQQGLEPIRASSVRTRCCQSTSGEGWLERCPALVRNRPIPCVIGSTVGSGDCGLGARWPVGRVSTAQHLLTLW